MCERDPRVLLDDEHGEPVPLVQLADDPEDLAHDHRREPERRLVEHQQARSRHQRAREREHLLLAARQRPRRLVARARDPREPLRHPVDVGLEARDRAACTRRARRFSVTVSSVNVPRPSGTWAIPARATASGPPRSGLPANGSSPERRTVPEIARSVVVLPAPLAPRTATICALGDLERHPAERLNRPVAGLDAVERRAADAVTLVGTPRYASITAGIGLHLRGRAGGDLATEAEHVDEVRDAHHEAHVVLDEQDRQRALVPEAHDEVAELLDLDVVEPAGRLVEQEQRRLRHRARARSRRASASRTGAPRPASAARSASPTTSSASSAVRSRRPAPERVPADEDVLEHASSSGTG